MIRSVMPIDELIERWIQAIKVPFLTYDDPQRDIPDLLPDMARRERFIQANNGNTDPLATDSEVYLYLLTKYFASDYTQDDLRLLVRLSDRLHAQYPAIVPDPGPALREYSRSDPELSRKLKITAGYLQVEKERFYEQHLQEHAEACWARFGCYLDPAFILELDDYGNDVAKS